MHTDIIHAEESTLEAFADKHGLELIVKEQAYRARGSKDLYWAYFKDINPSSHMFQHGEGATPEAAIDDYRTRISGRQIHKSYNPPKIVCTLFFVGEIYEFIDCPRFVKA